MCSMERKEAMKMEDLMKLSYFNDGFLGNNNNNMLMGFSDYNNNGEVENNNGSSLGFMELLGMQDFDASLLFDNVSHQQQEEAPVVDHQTENKNKKTTTMAISTQEPSEVVVNTPATPNSSSISSESNEMHNKTALDDDNDGEEHHKTNKLLKPKKTSQKKKKEREARFAFMTKSDVDHLEDGYRWRKYGQKAVKNSPFPRSYYRCTSASCNVKKRVERCFNDPSIVVTTYEGQHTHLSPMMPRHNPVGLPPGFSFSANTVNAHFQQPMHFTSSHQPEIINNNLTSFAGPIDQELYTRRLHNTPQYSAALLRDNGLLQDIVPSIIRKEE